MEYNELQENISEGLKLPIKVGDWVSGRNFDIGEVKHVAGDLVTIKVVDSVNHEPGDIIGAPITSLTIIDKTDVEKKVYWDKQKKFESKVEEGREQLLEDLSYSADRAKFHLDNLVKRAKDSTSEIQDVVRYLKDVMDVLRKIDWDKLKKK
jgi:hypothetical protein